MKKICLSVLFTASICSLGFTQELRLSGVLLETESNEPIPFASIAVMGTPLGCISNEVGQFNLFLPNDQSDGILKFQSIGFEDDTISVSSLMSRGTDTFYLNQKVNELNEVIVLAESKETMLKKIIRASSEQFSSNIILESYYREMAYFEEQPQTYADALIDCYINTKRKNIDPQMELKQWRALPGEEDDDATMYSFVTVHDLCEAYELEDFNIFNPDTWKNYTIELYSDKTDQSEQSLYKFVFVPKQGIEKPLADTEIWADPNTMTILKITTELSDDYKEFIESKSIGIVKFTVLDYNKEYHFRQDGDLYFMNYARIGADIFIESWVSSLDEKYLRTTSDIMIQNVRANPSGASPEEEFKRGRVYAEGTDYTTPYWNTTSSLPLAPRYQSIMDLFKEE